MSIETIEIGKAVTNGMRSFARPEPLRLSEWADANFYLSTESSYIEGRWETFPPQKTIMDCMSNDDIREVTLKKSARVGYTKMILASIGYYAAHKKRNQGVWQPVDDDADEFVKTEIDPMIRDVQAIQKVFPWFNKRHKNNTLRQKVFIGSNLHIRGGKAAKNYRRISIDVAYGDEIDGFDRDVEKEGNPRKLYGKRVEGATFPKIINGSTPKVKGSSLIDDTLNEMALVLKFHIPCPRCGYMHPLIWGGLDVVGGMKWEDNDPSTAKMQCPACEELFSQDEYLNRWTEGRYEVCCDHDDLDPCIPGRCGVWVDEDCNFRAKDGELVETPSTVGFHIWTAYSPMTSWAQIVREWLDAQGKPNDLKTFINQTLGECWEEEVSEKIEHSTLYIRREIYKHPVPEGVVELTAGIDTQDDRFEGQIDGWGAGEERWTIEYFRLYGDPSRAEIWNKLHSKLTQQFVGKSGAIFNIRLVCQDHGGHYSDEVSAFSRKCGVMWLIPVKGSSVYGKTPVSFPTKKNDKGVYLTMLGTDTIKDLLSQRIKITERGPGYWHWPISDEFDEDYFRMLTNEEKAFKWVKGVKQTFWDAKKRRQEPWDCSVYSLAAIRILQQHMGIILERQAQIRHHRGVRSKGV